MYVDSIIYDIQPTLLLQGVGCRRTDSNLIDNCCLKDYGSVGTRGFVSLNIPSGLSDQTQVCKTHNPKSVLMCHTSSSPVNPSGALGDNATGTAYSTATSIKPPFEPGA